MNDRTKVESPDSLEAEEMSSEFLKAINHSTNLKKVFVHFKLKGNPIEYREWLTNREYRVFSKMRCVEFANLVS